MDFFLLYIIQKADEINHVIYLLRVPIVICFQSK